MQAGKLDKRITLQASARTNDGLGSSKNHVWSDVARVWASIRHLSGDERRATQHGGEQAGARTEITMRHRAGVDATMRVLYGADVYNIRHVNNVGQGNYKLILTCDLEGGI